jgi:hypothetical protein
VCHAKHPPPPPLRVLTTLPRPLQVEGLVHVANMSKRPISSAKDFVKRGQEVGGGGTPHPYSECAVAHCVLCVVICCVLSTI